LLKAKLIDEYEQHNRPIQETLEVIIVAGVRSFEVGNS